MKLTKPVMSVSRRTQRRVQVTAPAKRFPIVGIGGSAGGLAAFVRLLENLPADTGMAFVFVQHLLPGHESGLAQILGRATTMAVSEATQGMRVRPNGVYVSPANVAMTLSAGRLHLTAHKPTQTPHLSIDLFFQSLAHEQHQLAIGIVCSGHAADGTQGLEEIKAGGGITFAQDKSAECDSMPCSAIAAGCVDFVLAPAGIARELVRIAGHPYFQRLLPLRSDNGAVPARISSRARAVEGKKSGEGLAEILELAQKHSGVDFSLRKPGPVEERIARRMLLRRKPSLAAYVRFVRADPAELGSLCRDLLAGVTSFFRDEAAFDALKKKVFPKMIDGSHGGALRLWTVGCASGQETYSLAMAFVEAAEKSPRHAPKLQIFGTDVDDTLLNRARRGLYSKNLAREISAARLQRFFVEEPGGYRVTKALRSLCIFGRQDVLGSAPFSQMDLISCRNVLSGVDAPAQQRILTTLHFALRPPGYLLLGNLESVGACAALFASVDRKQKIFVRKSGPTPDFSFALRRSPGVKLAARRHGGLGALADGLPLELQARQAADRIMLGEFGPPSVLVDAAFNVLEFRGATDPFLTTPSGKASFQLLRMARPALVLPLRAALAQARKQNKPVRREGVRVNPRTGETTSLQVMPLKNFRGQFFLVVFGRARAHPGGTPAPTREPAPAGILGDRQMRRRNAELERELQEMRGYLKSLQQEHDTIHEEMQASLEEAQSVNEELQSVNEELETSKEELQSGNEALLRTNEEMTSGAGKPADPRAN